MTTVFLFSCPKCQISSEPKVVLFTHRIESKKRKPVMIVECSHCEETMRYY